ncbi:copper ion binding isoform 1 [Tanacetum coccineum]
MTSLNKIKPLTSSLGHRFQQQCSVSGTAKGKGKVKDGAALKRSKITIKKGGAGQPSPDTTSQSKGNRKSQLEQIIDDCLHSKPPVRSLKPKHRQREAEREKMGLLSEERKLEIANFKKQTKNDKNSVNDASNQGALMIGTEGLDLISLGVVDGDKLPKYELTVEDGMKLAKEYSRVLMRKHRARQAAESGLLKCKKEAIEALPEGLKEKALVPDLAPFPVNRFMATLTPPIEGYIEKVKEIAKRQGTIKGKLR